MPHIHDLKVENDVLKGQVNDLKSENGALKTNLDNLTKDVKSMQNSLSQMSTMLTERSHFESGKLECGDSNSWTGRESGQTSSDMNFFYYPNQPYRYTTVTKQFNIAYGKPPQVQLAVTDIDFWDNSKNWLIYYIDLVSVDERSFTFRCRIEDHAYFRVRGMSVTWASLPN